VALLIALLVIPLATNGLNGLKWELGHIGLGGLLHIHPHNPVKTTTTDQVIGNVILEKVAGVSDPALGRADFNFDIERKVDKSFLLFKCWYAQDWHAEAHASANVNFNPGPNWWAKGSGHYVMTRVGHQVTVNLVLPRPTLPATVHQVVIDNTTSHALGAPMHSFSYPGPGCGPGVRNPHFSNEDFYPISQQIAFALVNGQPVKIDNVTMLNTATSADIRQRVTAAAEAEAHQLYMTTFIGPTVAGYGDHLAAVNIKWVPQSTN